MEGSMVLVMMMVAWLTGCATGQNDVREPPRITAPLEAKPIYAKNDQTVRLSCSADGSPAPTYQWKRDGQIVESDGSIIVDGVSGSLVIRSMSTGYEGGYQCWATTTFPDGLSAVALSPKIDVSVAYADLWPNTDTTYKTGQLYDYISFPCQHVPESVGPTKLNWYDNQDSQITAPRYENNRFFLDSTGTLHFTYLKEEDGRLAVNPYLCSLYNEYSHGGQRGSPTSLKVNHRSLVQRPPVLRFSSNDAGPDALTFKTGTRATLQCVFSGFINEAGNEMPHIIWKDSAGSAIEPGGRYSLKFGRRELLIDLLTEDDDGQTYTCQVDNQLGRAQDSMVLNITCGRYSLGSRRRELVIDLLTEDDDGQTYTCQVDNQLCRAQDSMVLNITSAPIMVKPLKADTKPQGQAATLDCQARSADTETPPEEPVWYRNGVRLDRSYDPRKFQFVDGKKTLIVKNVSKSADIACFQCVVRNSVGETFQDACLNVILPIQITQRPPAHQVVTAGDVVDLTVLATTDPLFPLYYEYEFRNTNYTKRPPPFATQGEATRLTYINTTGLSEKQMESITGVYHIVVYHRYQQVEVGVDVSVSLPEVKTVADGHTVSAGLVIAVVVTLVVLLVLVLLVIVVYILCRRKMQEGDYPVDRKETAAGLEPDKEAKGIVFPGLTRADYDSDNDHPPDKLSSRDVDESFGSAQYSKEPSAFREDGSFIGAYQDKGTALYTNHRAQPESETYV